MTPHTAVQPDPRVRRARDTLAALTHAADQRCPHASDAEHPDCDTLAEDTTVARDVAAELLAHALQLLTTDSARAAAPQPDAEACGELAIELRMLEADLRRGGTQLGEPTCAHLETGYAALAAAQRCRVGARALEHAAPPIGDAA